MKQRVWINFKELRARLKAEAVLHLHGVELNRKGDQHQGCCPLPLHQGDRRAQSFSVNLEKGIFQCFGCKAKGNILEFAALMKGVNPEDGGALRSVAVELQSKFFPEGASSRSPARSASEPPPEPRNVPVIVNAPLNFELKGLDRTHEWFARNGFTVETMQRFGVGFCSRGLFKDKIVVPLHDQEGKMLGYAGAAIDKGGGHGRPDFIFPSRRENQGKVYDLHRDRFLYNGHRIGGAKTNLIVAQEFPSVWRFFQDGVREIVAIMGRELSAPQVEQLLSLVNEAGTVWIVPDGDADGDAFASSCLRQLSEHRSVRRIRLGEGERPSDVTAEKIKAYFTW